ncbi:MAG: hypothetical protein ACKOQ7_01145 [Actinomycetota bacterium]
MVSPDTVISTRTMRDIARLDSPTAELIALVAGEVFAARFADEILAALSGADTAD